jgi:carboxylesterase
MRLMGSALHEKGVTVLGVRLAGHATSPQDLARTRWQDWLASVEDGIYFLSDSCEEVFIAGLSLGGLLSLIAASRYAALRGVIAMSTPYTLGPDWRLKFARPLSCILPTIKKGHNETHDPVTANAHVDYPAYPTRGIAELHELTQLLPCALTQIGIPVLLINSKADQTVPLFHAEQIGQSLTSTKVERLIVKDSGHVITEDTEREVVFERVIQFIRRYSSL